MRPVLPVALLCLAASLMACAQFPELDAAVSEKAKAAERPVLKDNRVVLDPADALLVDEETQEELVARADALLARAEDASGPVISPEERKELLERAAALRARAKAARVAQQG